MHQPHIRAGGRYPVLRTIAILWLVGAVVTFCYGIYQAVCAMAGWHTQEAVRISNDAFSGRMMAALIWLATTFFAVLLSIAVAEMIKLFIDMEENMRMLALSGRGTNGPVTAVDGGRGRVFEEETAEGALIRGH